MLLLNPEWPPDVQQAAAAGEVTKGMTRNQVLAAWGFPYSRQRYLIDEGPPFEHEAWRYRNVVPPMEVSFEGDGVHYVGYLLESAYLQQGVNLRPPEGQWGYQLRSARGWPPESTSPSR
jgi:hypothetical protein